MVDKTSSTGILFIVHGNNLSKCRSLCKNLRNTVWGQTDGLAWLTVYLNGHIRSQLGAHISPATLHISFPLQGPIISCCCIHDFWCFPPAIPPLYESGHVKWSCLATFKANREMLIPPGHLLWVLSPEIDSLGRSAKPFQSTSTMRGVEGNYHLTCWQLRCSWSSFG